MRNATEEMNSSALAHDCSLLLDFRRHVQHVQHGQAIYLVRVARICQCEKRNHFGNGRDLGLKKVQRGHTTWHRGQMWCRRESVRKHDRLMSSVNE